MRILGTTPQVLQPILQRLVDAHLPAFAGGFERINHVAVQSDADGGLSSGRLWAVPGV
jgi:hypothetical protein